jgi:hypothetical protein
MPVTFDNEKASKCRCDRETPLETGARLRAEFGIEPVKQAREPLPRRVYDELSGEDRRFPATSRYLTDLVTIP